jgi:dTDP-4-amino-4,6-dideoxygalactose transaminase
MRLMRNFGFSGVDDVTHSGTNGKMIEIAAAMGLVNLDAINNVIAVNYRNYRTYFDGLAGLPGISLLTYDENERNNYQYVVMEVGEECPINRDQIVQALHAENILARKYFWPGCHNMKPYRDMNPKADSLLPNTQKVAGTVVVLPTGTTMTKQMVENVVAIVQMLILGET